MALTMEIQMPRRRADAQINNAQDAKTLGVTIGSTQQCHVLGLFQISEDCESIPAFVCEFNNGTVLALFVECVRFVDTDERGEIIDDI